MKLYYQILFYIVIATLITLCVSVIAVVLFERSNYLKEVDQAEVLLSVLAEGEREEFANELFEDRRRALELRLEKMLLISEIYSAVLYNPDGQIVASAGRISSDSVSGLNQKFKANPELYISWTVVIGDSQGLVFASPVTAVGSYLGYLQLEYSLESEIHEMRMSVGISILALVFLLIFLSLVMTFVFKRSILLPISRLIRAIGEIDRTGPGVLVDIDSSDEMGRLGLAFNTLSANLAEEHEKNTAYARELEQSVKEKDVLLKEVHHRVKNNMQIISALLGLQSAKIEDPVVSGHFSDTINRVNTMALVHEKIYKAEDLVHINIEEYLGELITQLAEMYKRSYIKINLRIEEMDLGISAIIPLGLIVNELVTNSMKYAFDSSGDGSISLSLSREKDIGVLFYSDSGKGIPDDISIESTDTLGIMLINNLANQLGGKAEIIRQDSGTAFKITMLLHGD